MGSVTSAFTRTRNALVKVGSEPDHHHDAAAAAAVAPPPPPEPDRDRDRVRKKKSARSNVTTPQPSQPGRQSTRPQSPLSEAPVQPDGDDGPRAASKSSQCKLRGLSQ
ncbi:hypothetical protein NHX12_003816 [Muraenolepis orangiensis]|uniref:Uncharacterized protein n=1 Tax=Muraenolepis orangiensis TaxID=630683 RepID=A0A9Q0DU14_9TELE|nr:hypothetical protein NHX12_003816 [Muraenolepis orangiensis]